MRVVVGPHPERQALVQRAARQPLELGHARLQHRHAPVGRELHRLADPLVLFHAPSTYRAAGARSPQ